MDREQMDLARAYQRFARIQGIKARTFLLYSSECSRHKGLDPIICDFLRREAIRFQNEGACFSLMARNAMGVRDV
jgi:hypothetical protein